MTVARERITRRGFEAEFVSLRDAVSRADLVTVHAAFTRPLPRPPSPSADADGRPGLDELGRLLRTTSVARLELCVVRAESGRATLFRIFDVFVTPRPCAGRDVCTVWRASRLCRLASSVPAFKAAVEDGVPYVEREHAAFVCRRVRENMDDPVAAVLGCESKLSSDYVDAVAQVAGWLFSTSDNTFEVDLKPFAVPEVVKSALLAIFFGLCVLDRFSRRETLWLKRVIADPDRREGNTRRSRDKFEVLKRLRNLDEVAVESLSDLNKILHLLAGVKDVPIFFRRAEETLVVLHRMGGFVFDAGNRGEIGDYDVSEVPTWMPNAADVDFAFSALRDGKTQRNSEEFSECHDGFPRAAGDQAAVECDEPEPESLKMARGVLASTEESGRSLRELAEAGRVFT